MTFANSGWPNWNQMRDPARARQILEYLSDEGQIVFGNQGCLDFSAAVLATGLDKTEMENLIDLLRAFLGMFDRTAQIAHDVRELGCKTTAQHHHTTNQLGDLMGKFDDVKAGIQANTQQAAKAQAEIRTKLDELLAKQQEVEAAVAAALAADAATDEADFDAKMNELQGAVNEQKAAMQALDDVVPDAPANPTEPTEPGTPTEPAPPVDPNEPPPAPPTDTPAPV